MCDVKYDENGRNGPCAVCPNFTEGFTEEQKNSLHHTVRFRATKEYNDGWCSISNHPTRKIDGCDRRPREEIFAMLEGHKGFANG